MEFRVLGPLEVASADRPLRLGGYRQRLVLAVLLLHPNRPVRVEWLVDAVWGERPPRTARKTLQAYVSRLRTVLGPAAIVATAGGYTLIVAHDGLDSTRFEQLADEGHRLLESDPAAAGRVLRSALSLWRGVPWGDLGDEPAIVPEAQRLRERRIAAVADRIAADLELGHAARLVGELEGLVEAHPWHERFRGQLMLAFYRSGQQSDALRVFQDARRALGEELGIEPSVELRELEEKILLQDPSLANPTGGAALDEWERARARNPYKGLRAFQYDDRADFFGREDLVDRLADRVASRSFVALVGASGSGKSSVVMAGVAPRLPPQSWTVATMVPGRDPFAALQSALARAGFDIPDSLGAAGGDDLDLLRVLQARPLAPRRQLLLVIDQFDELFQQVHEAAVRGRFVRNLAEAIEDPSSQLCVLVTLRADVLDRAMEQPVFGSLIEAGMIGVLPLLPHELEAAAARPAERAGVHLEPELIAQLVSDMTDQPGALPQFQYVLTLLFENRSGPVLTRSLYRRLGGLTGAVRRRAEDVFAELDAEARLMVRQVFMRLVSVGPEPEYSRRRVVRTALEEVDPGGTTVKAVLDAFDEARLITFDRDPVSGEATVEVAHEALLREWPRMRDWLDAARRDLQQHAALVPEVTEWERSGREPDYLLSGARLDLYDMWRANTTLDLTGSEAAFLAASRTQREEDRAREEARRNQELELERRSVHRLRALVVVVSIAALVAAGLTLFAVNRSREASASQREARARELANAALVHHQTDPELAILLALAAVDVTRSTDGTVVREAEEALHEAVGAQRLLQIGPGSFDVAFLPDGRLASGGERARIWDPATGNELLLGLGEVISVAASPDGSLVATGGGRGSLVVWDSSSGDEVRRFGRNGRRAHDRFIHDVVFSSDGTLLASASGSVGGDQTVRVWDVASGAELVSVERPEGAMWDVLGETPQLAFDPDGGRLALTGFGDEAARMLDVASGAWVAALASPGEPARSVHFLAGGDRMVTSGAYGSIAIWDAKTAQPVYSIPLESDDLRILHADVSSDGSTLAATCDDGAIRVWQLLAAGAREAITVTGSDVVLRIAFSPDGDTLAAATEERVELWDIGSGGRGEVRALPGEGAMTAFSPDGRYLAVAQGGDVVVLDAHSWDLRARLDHRTGAADPGPAGVAWSPGGDRIVTATPGDRPGIGPWSIRLWDAATGALLSAVSDVWQPGGDIVFGAGGYIAAALCQRSADTGRWESPARVWDAATGRERFAVPAADCADAVDIGPSGRLLAVQLEDAGEVQIWDFLAGVRIGAVPHEPGSGGAVRFAPDGLRLVTAGFDGTAQVWAVDDWELLHTLEGHAGAVTEAIWSWDGETVLTGGADGTIRMWNAATGAAQLVLRGHRGGVVGLSVSPDGARLASSGTDDVVRVWAIDLDELIEIAESRLSREFTPAECVAFRVEDCPGLP